MSVDHTVENTGYRLGRLFAMMDWTRKLASSDPEFSIDETDIKNAISNPTDTFTALFA